MSRLIDPESSALVLVDLQEQLLPAIHEHERVVAAAGWLAGIAHELAIPCHLTEQYPERLGATTPAVAGRVPGAVRHAKMCFAWPREPEGGHRGLPRQVVVAGTEAHVCVLQTALALREGGHDVFMVAEAVGSRRAADRQLALERFAGSGGVVVGAEMVAFEWLVRAGTDAFRRVLPQLRAGWEAELPATSSSPL